MTGTIKVGVLPWGQRTEWTPLQEVGRRADELGYDSLWTWDHLYPIQGDWRGPIFEGYLTLTGWAGALRVTLGLMVGANTFRNPALTAKYGLRLSTTSATAAPWLGVGGAWFEREHEAYGIDFGSGFGERLDRLDEAVQLMHGMLRGEEPTAAGPAYHAKSVRNDPPPSRSTCRSSSAATASKRRSRRSRGMPTPGTQVGTSSSSATRTRCYGGGAATSAGTKPISSEP